MGDGIKNRLAQQVARIKHWKIFNKSYAQAQNKKATWFVDPPYCGESGRLYKYKFQDYKTLADWCHTLEGQVMVCEKLGADWLPFEFFATCKAMEGKRGKKVSHEVIWKNL